MKSFKASINSIASSWPARSASRCLLAILLYSICHVDTLYAQQVLGQSKLDAQVILGVEDPITLSLDNLPPFLEADSALGLLRHSSVQGQVLHVAPLDVRGLFETRAVRTPKGDLMVMFPVGNHYAAGAGKVNSMIMYRSQDDGKSWEGPAVAFDIEYSQHGFIPLIPKGSKRIYAFGTQPIPSQYSREKGKFENAPIGFRWSDDDGYTWSRASLIQPVNDPGFLGMSVTRMCETANGAWLLGSHAADWSKKPLETQQYILRSPDQCETWHLLPGARKGGWSVPEFNRMDEGRPIFLQGSEVFFMARTPAGQIWTSRSHDDGQSWSDPKPSSLVHPDAPPMVFHSSDRKTLINFFHNRHTGTQYTGLSGTMDGMKDRSEIWVTLSSDGGRNWSEPRFLFANATQMNPEKNGWFNHQVSYLDAVINKGTIHIFCPHLWNRAVYLTLKESDLQKLPTKEMLQNTFQR